ncbi:Non-structural maintenance of chromosomes element 1 [Thelohanellus kitauei]|uniref:Non-structural maintenance of chromosomes element 1 homolog n=1 Tax=Thelohanellus kitauei TaxID=669202 RepID=A0A0C2MHE4_THEKT|nr:Non-structural maintenance of chromosomes element 1 [Thelohanellus kitauei]
MFNLGLIARMITHNGAHYTMWWAGFQFRKNSHRFVMDSSVDEIDRLVLQTLIRKRTLRKSDIKEIMNRLSEEKKTTLHFKDVLKSINTKLEPINFEISYVRSEMDGQLVFGIIDHNQDDITNISNSLKPVEISVFTKIIDHYIDDPETPLTIEKLQNIVANENRSSADTFKSILQHLIDELWIVKVDNTVLISDFAQITIKYRMRKGGDIENKICAFCSDILIHGMSCKNCRALFHKCCSEIYQTRTGNKNCVKCQNTL